MAVTMNDVAKLAGVSIKTVSNVVNDYEFLRPATKQKVLAAIEELGYQTNLTARSLRSGRTGMIGLVVMDLSVTYYAELASKLMSVAAESDYRVLVEQTGATAENELAALTGTLRQLTDALIHIPLAADAESIIARRGVKPLVLLGEQVMDPRLDLITMKNSEAARALTMHLLGNGRRRIAVLGATPEDIVGTSGLRLAGYRDALGTFGIPFDPNLVIPCDWSKRGGRAAVAAFIESRHHFDAVFGLNDDIALGAMHELQVRGISIPESVAVCGFDDIEEASFSTPALTTVAPGIDEIARAIIDRISEMLAAPDQEFAPLYREAEFEVRVRASAPS